MWKYISYATKNINKWKSRDSLGLTGGLVEEWNNFVGILCTNFVILDDKISHSLCWLKNLKDGSFTSRLGYKSWSEGRFKGPQKRWWGHIWKIKSPPI
jgi:hypothetical protein